MARLGSIVNIPSTVEKSGLHLMELKFAADLGRDAVRCFDEMIENGGQVKTRTIQEAQRNGQKFNKAVGRLIKRIDEALDTKAPPPMSIMPS